MKRRYLITLEILLLAGLCVWLGLTMHHKSPEPDGVELKVQLRGARDTAVLVPDGMGGFSYLVTAETGVYTLDPDTFSRKLYEDQRSRTWVEMLLNVSSPVGFIWVTVGLMGQVLFTGRMIVQWAVSEKHQQSVVPTSFWWMSLIGATMLLVYFAWRKDPVGLLGQAFGWFIYVRNLYFIYRGGHEHAVPAGAMSDATRH